MSALLRAFHQAAATGAAGGTTYDTAELADHSGCSTRAGGTPRVPPRNASTVLSSRQPSVTGPNATPIRCGG